MMAAAVLRKCGMLLTAMLVLFLSSCKCSHQDSGVKTAEKKEIAPKTDAHERWSNLAEVGFPVMPDSIPSRLIERYCYTVSYNDRTRQPNWVMWQLTGEHVLPHQKGVWHEYREDMSLPRKARAMMADYASSGYDRGHMCPSGDCNWDEKGRGETFLLSNMCPQNPNLNRGDWKEIELACRKWAKTHGNIYIVCGPIFFKSERHQKIGADSIPVPEAFFKVVLCPDSLSPKGIGFICRNTDGNRLQFSSTEHID